VTENTANSPHRHVSHSADSSSLAYYTPVDNNRATPRFVQKSEVNLPQRMSIDTT